MSQDVWQQPEIITWSQLLLDSYQRLLGKQLIARIGNAEEDAKILFLPLWLWFPMEKKRIQFLIMGIKRP